MAAGPQWMLYEDAVLVDEEGAIAIDESCCCRTACCPNAPEHLKAIFEVISGGPCTVVDDETLQTLDGFQIDLDAPEGETNHWVSVEAFNAVNCEVDLDLACRHHEETDLESYEVATSGLYMIMLNGGLPVSVQCDPFRIEFEANIVGECCTNPDDPNIIVRVVITERDPP